MHKHALQAT